METSLYDFVVTGFLQMLVAMFGIVGNSLNVLVFTRPEMKSSVNVLLLSLAVADNIYLVGRIFINGLILCLRFMELSCEYQYIYHPIIYPYAQLFLNTGRAASIYLTIAITLERFIVVYWPLKARTICTVKTAWKTSAAIYTFSLLYMAPKYFEHYLVTIVANKNETTTLINENETEQIDFDQQNENDRSYQYQTLYLTYMYIIFKCIIPFITLTIFNAAIYVKIREANRLRKSLTQSQRMELSITKMLFCVVLVFGLCYLPSGLAYFARKYSNLDKTLMDQIFNFGFLTPSINSAVNFVIYFIMSTKFRATFVGLWKKRISVPGQHQLDQSRLSCSSQLSCSQQVYLENIQARN